jgi:hypothetical protein
MRNLPEPPQPRIRIPSSTVSMKGCRTVDEAIGRVDEWLDDLQADHERQLTTIAYTYADEHGLDVDLEGLEACLRRDRIEWDRVRQQVTTDLRRDLSARQMSG